MTNQNSTSAPQSMTEALAREIMTLDNRRSEIKEQFRFQYTWEELTSRALGFFDGKVEGMRDASKIVGR